MNILKKISLFSLSIVGSALAFPAFAATSTTIIDTPDIAALINNMYTSAEPFMDALWPIVGIILGIVFVFGIIKLIISVVGGKLGR